MERFATKQVGPGHVEGKGTDVSGNAAGPRGDQGRKGWQRLPLGLLLGALALAYLLGWHEHISLAALAESRESLKMLVQAHPLLAPLFFALAYALAVAIAFPAAWVLTVLGGFLFGWAVSTLLIAFAATAGSTVLFLSARSACGERFRAKLKGRFASLAEGFERNAFAYLLALRLAPVLPFVLLNIAPAFFSVRLRTFILATFLGILPGVLAYSWLGQGLESALLAAEARGGDVSAADLVTPELTIGLTLIALVAAAGAVIKGFRRQKG